MKYSIAVLTVSLQSSLDFPGGSDGKESTCNAEDLGLIPGLGRSLERGLGNPLQARILEWVAKPSFKGSSQPWDQTQVFRIAGRFFTI